MGFKLVLKIPSSNTNFELHLPNINTCILEKSLKEKEFKDAFFASKANISPGCDKLHVNDIKKLYKKLKIPLMNIFSLSLETGIFLKKWKFLKFQSI